MSKELNFSFKLKMNRDSSCRKSLDNANLDYGTLPKHLGS